MGNPLGTLRKITIVATILLLMAGGAVAALRNLGYWLESPDPLRGARAVVVLGGGTPYRAIEAANLYRAGVTGEVWVTRGAPDLGDRIIANMGVAMSYEHQRSEAIMEALGVPRAAMREIPEMVDNTVSEMRAVEHFAGTDTRPVILVTSKYHVRRVRIVGKIVTAGRPPLIVRYAKDDPYDTAHWWRSSTDALSTFREVFGIVNAWAGFPVEPRDR